MSFIHKPVQFDFEGEIGRETGDTGRFYASPKGKKYPSITTVTGLRGKAGIQEWRARVGEEEANKIGTRAANRGTAVHDLMEKYVRGDEIDESKLMPHHKRSLNDLSKVMDEHLSEWYSMEKKMWSDYLGVAGQMDLAGRWDGVRSVIDYKTSAKVKKKEWISGYFMQEAAYSLMFEERTGIALPNLVIVMDVDNHGVIVFKEHRDNWVQPLKDEIAYYQREMRCRPL